MVKLWNDLLPAYHQYAATADDRKELEETREMMEEVEDSQALALDLDSLTINNSDLPVAADKGKTTNRKY